MSGNGIRTPGIDFAVINAYRAMDQGSLAMIAYRMERALQAIQLRRIQDPAILAGEIVTQAIAARSGK